jgi:hypothetical protein
VRRKCDRTEVGSGLIKVKANFTVEQAMKAQMRNRVIALLFL